METNLCVAGFGGQGVMTLGKFLASATCDATNKNVTFSPAMAPSSVAVPPTASSSSPMRRSARRWAISWMTSS